MIRIRHIQTETKIVDGKPEIVPVLDEHGRDVELWSLELPRHIAVDGLPAEIDQQDKTAIEAYIAAHPAPQS